MKSEEEQEPSSKGETSVGEISTEEKLDVFSASFDASEAIFNPDFVFPDPEAPVFDNVEILVKKFEAKPLPPTTSAEKADNPGKAKTKADPPASVQRQDRFQAILKEPAKEEGSGARPTAPKKNLSNVLTYMKKTDVKGGPMALLSECVKSKKRVKVLVRSVDRITGHLIGFLVAFDKHWNMALTDVEETFTRRKKVKSSPVADAEVIDMLKDVNLDSRNRPLGGKMSSRKGKSDSKPGSEKSGRNPTGNPSSSEVIGFSTVRVIERKRKAVLCQRHIPQIVLRGEHVACVIPVAAS